LTSRAIAGGGTGAVWHGLAVSHVHGPGRTGAGGRV